MKLDSLMDLVGELVIAQSQVCQEASLTTVENQRLTRKLAQLSRITKELQRNALALRMVPVRATFQKLIRLVRDVSDQQGKQVELLLAGEDTELDRTLVEEIADPLVHMIRNSIDHGIEPPEERVSAGKSPAGTIRLSACHRGGNIVIQVQDDGRGLNHEKLLARARERGLITGQDRLTEREAWALIFAAGFSTAESVTEISGRGVGMDVVRRNIEKLRGKIDLESTPGGGTTFTLSLPLTLAIIDALIVAIGEQRFILPTLSVREALRPTREMLATTPEQGEMVSVRGQLIPLLRLHEFYDVKPRTTDPTEALLVVVENK
ncbi:MAG TPA: chemotaxis protein CheA, partial [Verrucomicrobiae bacterium]|nr:chemotaxis protein CheA [Verrucomicrobiae bacterium]